jgi:hypothetical protein
MVADFINVGIEGRGVFIPFKQGLDGRLFQIPRKNEGRFAEVDADYNAVVVLVIEVLMGSSRGYPRVDRIEPLSWDQ